MTGHARSSTAPRTGRAPTHHLAAVAAGAMVAGALSVLPAGAWAAGTTRYVGQTGCNDAGPGTSATAPFCTITKAVAASASGDTVSVAPGTYAERVNVTPTASGVSIVAPQGAVIDGGGSLLYGFSVQATAQQAVTGVTISGFTTSGQTGAGVYLFNCTGCKVDHITATGSGSNGIKDEGGNADTIDHVTISKSTSVGILVKNATGVSVTSSVSHDNGSHGVSVQGGSGDTVSGVTSYANVNPSARIATGIDVSSSSTGVTVEASTTYGNQDSGIQIYPGSSAAQVRRNLSYGNGDHGIDVAGSPNAAVVSNTVVGNTNVGINVEASGAGVASTGVTLRDNISAENGIHPAVNPTTGATGSPGEIRVDTPSTSGTTLDRDLVWRADGGQLFQFGGTYASTLAGVQAAGQEANGLVADPKFASANDFHLTLASPAVDAAFAGVPGWRAADHDGAAPVDQPTVADTGTGTPTFADLGAFELTSVTPPPPAPNPSAQLTAAPAQVTTGGTSTLDASGSKATAPGATIASYAFSCGNGTAAVVDQNIPSKATCTYPQAQTAPYTASVTVTDSNKNTATATATVTVTNAPTAPTAALVATPDKVTTGGSSTLDATASKATATGATITGYAFDCGNNAAATQVAGGKATCTYAKAGTYTAAVTVTDSNKNTAKATATITVADAPAPPPGPGPQPGPGPAPGPAPKPSAPVAQLTALPSLLVAGGAVTLDASGSHATATGATISGYRFDCGTGVTATSGTSPTTLCSYPDAGTYTAKVTVTDSLGGTASATAPVEVTAPQIAAPHARFKLRIKRLSHGRVRVLVLANTSKAAPGAELTGFRFFCGNGHHTRWVHRTYSACTYHPRHRAYRITVRVRDNLGKTDDAWRRLLYRHR